MTEETKTIAVAVPETLNVDGEDYRFQPKPTILQDVYKLLAYAKKHKISFSDPKFKAAADPKKKSASEIGLFLDEKFNNDECNPIIDSLIENFPDVGEIAFYRIHLRIQFVIAILLEIGASI